MFFTPFTCTEIIAPVKTLKYFALASKISDGAEVKSQNLLILTELNAPFLVLIWLLTTLFLFVFVILFMVAMEVTEEFQLDHTDASTSLSFLYQLLLWCYHQTLTRTDIRNYFKLFCY